MDPAVTKILQRMTDHIGRLRQFSAPTQVSIEDELASGHRVDFDVSARVIVSRPNKLRAERRGDLRHSIPRSISSTPRPADRAVTVAPVKKVP